MPTISAINSNVLDLIGNTPLLKISFKDSTIFAKLEKINPFGSVKDRVALNLINQAELEGQLQKGDTIIEASSGNTAIGLAAIAKIKGYKINVALPEDASLERIKLLKKLGARLIFISREDWGKNAIEQVKIMAKENNWKFLNQYENKANVEAHEKTGLEILNQLNGTKIDILVLGIGTGGTITGLSKILKKNFPQMKVFGILPKDNIEGIRNITIFSPKILDKNFIDGFIEINSSEVEDSFNELVNGGILVGKSSAAAFAVSKKIILQTKSKNVLTLFPDGIEKYLSYI